MTEREWLTTDNAHWMANSFLRDDFSSPSRRKARLYACAVARMANNRIPEEARGVITAAEDAADGMDVPLSEWYRKTINIILEIEGRLDAPGVAPLAYVCAQEDAYEACWQASNRWLGFYDSRQADLLRDIFGNIYRPFVLPAGPSKECPACDGAGGEVVPTYGPSRVVSHCGKPTQERRDTTYGMRDGHYQRWCSVCWAGFLPEHAGYRIDKICPCCKGRKTIAGTCPWLTPDVLAIARKAYNERPGLKCEKCRGTGEVAEKNYHGCWEDYGCDNCHGVGRIDDGTLDPDALCVLADALEEAGCPQEELVECPHCSEYHNHPDNLFGGARGYRPERDPASGRHEGGWSNCKTCNSGGAKYVKAGFVRLPHPILAHLRSPGPHVRGCHAIDLVLGKE